MVFHHYPFSTKKLLQQRLMNENIVSSKGVLFIPIMGQYEESSLNKNLHIAFWECFTC